MLTVFDTPTGDHSRYVVLSVVAPGLTNIQGLIEHHNDEDVDGFVAVARDGSSSPVRIERDGEGAWLILTDDENQDALVERILLASNGDVLEHGVYVPGFTTDQVPVFMVGV